MIIGLSQSFLPDTIEREIADVASARALICERRPDVPELFERRRNVYRDFYGESAREYLERAEDAVMLALARLGVRHGSFGNDFHAYHNENHALEILDRRLGRVVEQVGVEALPGRDWLALSLFATCHDLRQRETVDFTHAIGSNEAASIAETHRILEIAGFDPKDDRDLFIALEIMIAGSTFDARPAPMQAYNTAEILQTGGPLAPKLAGELDKAHAGWREDKALERAVTLALIASDLDTANVGERFTELAHSAARLAAEREMRAGRGLSDSASGAPVLNFLTDGQERYFFELHRFCSELGSAVFAGVKERNAPKVREVADALRARFLNQPEGSFTGAEVIATHLTAAE